MCGAFAGIGIMAGNLKWVITLKERLWNHGTFLFFRERMVTMEEIMMSGKEYLLYLRARQEQMKAYVLECFKEAMNGKLSEQELFEMVEEKFRCELPVDDPENVILKGILTNMLDWYEVQGYLAPVSMKNGPGYRLNRKKLKQAA